MRYNTVIMECPKCKAGIPDQTAVCSSCGFDINTWDALFKDVPAPQGHVNDLACILTENEKQEIENFLKDYYEKTKNAVIVVTRQNTKPLKPEQFVFWLFNEWGVGGKNNKGVMLLLALDERRIESEVGFGLENILSDEKSGEILDRVMVPHFKDGSYGKGLLEGAKAVASALSAS